MLTSYVCLLTFVCLSSDKHRDSPGRVIDEVYPKRIRIISVIFTSVTIVKSKLDNIQHCYYGVVNIILVTTIYFIYVFSIKGTTFPWLPVVLGTLGALALALLVSLPFVMHKYCNKTSRESRNGNNRYMTVIPCHHQVLHHCHAMTQTGVITIISCQQQVHHCHTVLPTYTSSL